MTDLKPCPFCGGKAYYYYERGNDSIVCEDCGAKLTYFDFGDANDELVKQWNTRQFEDKKGKEIKRLQQALEVILDATQKDEPCIQAIRVVAYMALKGDGE